MIKAGHTELLRKNQQKKNVEKNPKKSEQEFACSHSNFNNNPIVANEPLPLAKSVSNRSNETVENHQSMQTEIFTNKKQSANRLSINPKPTLNNNICDSSASGNKLFINNSIISNESTPSSSDKKDKFLDKIKKIFKF